MCVLCPPVSLLCPYYEVSGFQPQVVDNTETRIYASPQIHFQPPLRQSMHVRDDKNKGHTMGTFFSFIPAFCSCGCLFVHVFNLIFVIAIRCNIRHQHEHCFILLKVTEWDNLSCFVVSFQDNIFSQVRVLPFPSYPFRINQVPHAFICFQTSSSDYY